MNHEKKLLRGLWVSSTGLSVGGVRLRVAIDNGFGV